MVQEDQALPLFVMDEKATGFPTTHPELAIAVPASSRPVWLHGARATLLGDVRGGPREIRMDGRTVVADLRAEAGAVANAVVSPGLLRRERLSTRGSGQESILVSPTLPLVALTYEGARPAQLALVALPGAERTRYRVGGSTVTVRLEGSDDLLVVAAVPSSVTWKARSAPGGGLLLEVGSANDDVDAGKGLGGLVLAYGSEAAVRTAVAGARHLAGHALKAGSPLAGDLLTLSSGAAGLDHAVHWMEHRLAAGIQGATATSRGSTPEAWLWAGLGACAVGETRGAAACVRALDALHRPDEALLLASRVALVTGRQEDVLNRVRPSETLTGPSTRSSGLRRLALRTASDALRYAAPDRVVAHIRRAGEIAMTHDSGRPLPTLGGTGSPTLPSGAHDRGFGEALAYLLERGDSSRRRPTWTTRSDEQPRASLEAWTGLVAGDREAWARWRGLSAAGLDGSDGGVGVWEAFSAYDPPATTGILLAALVHGWLGIQPDAPVGRLSLAPRIPGNMTGLVVRGIRVGDASLDLEYTRHGSDHCFELIPRSGRVPPLVVFEPVVPAAGVERVLVDHEPADVDAIASGPGGTSVRLQTPADSRRRVEIRAR